MGGQVSKNRWPPIGPITLFDRVGFAIEDFSALRYVRGKRQETGLYVDLDLLADPARDVSRSLAGPWSDPTARLRVRDLNLRFFPDKAERRATDQARGFPKSTPCYPFLRPINLMASLISRMCTSWETWTKIMISAGLKEATHPADCYFPQEHSRAVASATRNGCEIPKTGLAPSA
ncbi:MAG: hypothetical protein E5W91_16725 [Mesorhizobium sp.]|nr:MAG: hypothetical protein E5W91_16725 [Mesorhizobium sp.]